MIWRMGRARADNCRDGTVYSVSVARARFHKRRPRPVSVDAEGFGKGDADNAFGEPRGDFAGHGAIGVPALGEAQIGKVDPGDDPACLKKIEQRVELLGGHVRAGRVVADTLHQKDIAGIGGFQPVQHLVKGDVSLQPVVIRHMSKMLMGRSQDRNIVAIGRGGPAPVLFRSSGSDALFKGDWI